jgi:hypothetical protein
MNSLLDGRFRVIASAALQKKESFLSILMGSARDSNDQALGGGDGQKITFFSLDWL